MSVTGLGVKTIVWVPMVTLAIVEPGAKPLPESVADVPGFPDDKGRPFVPVTRTPGLIVKGWATANELSSATRRYGPRVNAVGTAQDCEKLPPLSADTKHMKFWVVPWKRSIRTESRAGQPEPFKRTGLPDTSELGATVSVAA